MSPSSGTSSSPGADARVQPADVPPSAVAAATVRLRAAGCVFAEEEAALLAEAAASGGG
ncbi:release factor glutamine methyltransferase, partial [Streptomyces sp. IgraMP-1]